MAKDNLPGHPLAPVGALPRPTYEPGSYLAAEDLLAEQRYRRQRLRRHTRHLHCWGVMCGLLVVPANAPARPWAVQVCPGYAIDCCGDEIEVLAPAIVDVRDYLWRQPLQPQPAHVAYVGIRYAEEPVRPIPTSPPGCGCNDPVYQPSRIRDGFQVDILWTLPADPHSERINLCEPPIPVPCPQCPDNSHVILACITLPASQADPITRDTIDNWTYRQW